MHKCTNGSCVAFRECVGKGYCGDCGSPQRFNMTALLTNYCHDCGHVCEDAEWSDLQRIGA